MAPTPSVSAAIALAELTADASAPTGRAVSRKPTILVAEKLAAARAFVSAIAALAALTVGPSAPTYNTFTLTDEAIPRKPTILVVKKLDATRPEELRVLLCDELIVRSGTKVGYNEFEASGGRLRIVGCTGVGIDSVDLATAIEHGILVVILPFLIFIVAANVVPIFSGSAPLSSMARAAIGASDQSCRRWWSRGSGQRSRGTCCGPPRQGSRGLRRKGTPPVTASPW
ncbi:hypothetical protein GUJ93_ZPchr0006g43058 [Zizania palustris]|uniref:D-isomer specific 2-hydroxyacid dehydrogenase catalytic domain-containing protein n=1 Tax=Zizania palustris TaxID=103762 RepID=A0A8J5T620_ZIZPA|nr:hypothetical protein GUJ93_ZPchr0006g43058 [Zizania palustris]